MGLLSRLKALLGFDDDRTEPTRRDNVDVTIERTPDGTARPDAETEAAVKGVDEAETPPPSEPEVEPEPEPELESESETEPEPEPERVIEEAEPDEEIEPEPESEPEPEEETAEPEPTEELEPEPAEEEPTTDEPEPEERVPLEDINGIGPSYAERLADAGVGHVAALAEADADELAERTDLSAKRIGRWIEAAQEY